MSTESLKSETNVTGRRSVTLKIPTNNNTGKMLHNPILLAAQAGQKSEGTITREPITQKNLSSLTNRHAFVIAAIPTLSVDRSQLCTRDDNNYASINKAIRWAVIILKLVSSKVKRNKNKNGSNVVFWLRHPRFLRSTPKELNKCGFILPLHFCSLGVEAEREKYLVILRIDIH
jgi:hypothetical protein